MRFLHFMLLIAAVLDVNAQVVPYVSSKFDPEIPCPDTYVPRSGDKCYRNFFSMTYGGVAKLKYKKTSAGGKRLQCLGWAYRF